MKLYLLAVAATILVLAGLAASSIVRAQARAAFKDPAAVQLAMDNTPLVFMAVLCDMFPQEMIDAIEAAVCPAQDNEQRRANLQQIRLGWLRAGFAENSEEVVMVDARIAEILEPELDSIR